MPEPFVFDPRCPLCKTPFGAAPCGEEIALHVRPLAAEGFCACRLLVREEFSRREWSLPLSPAGQDGERRRFSLTFSAPAQPELLWYAFSLTRADGSTCRLGPRGYAPGEEAGAWQLTVYRPSPAPAWFQEGVAYQIFPDRFCRLPDDPADPTGLVGERWVHAAWEEEPAWQPEEDGQIRNRDFFGGTLRGITARLDDLRALGVTALYLCPIFESASNHRYNTADYTRIDPMLGTEADFGRLCREAHRRGMRVILDGVFNHTGSQSRYFNADGFYPTLGAAQSQDSPYFDWFSFHPWPTDYDAWWGISTLPAVREESPSYRRYIAQGPQAIVRRWLRAGADGWRLDVADELPDDFICLLRQAVEETKPDALLLGEVWEDASNKIAYSRRRRYLLGQELHGVMNYPFRTALLDYLRGGDADDFRECLETLRENYPPQAFRSCMNFLGTHDTPRALTVLGAESVPPTREGRAAFRLSPRERRRGGELLRLAALVLFTFPGCPTVYYGDEVGMEGWEDPFNRGTYPYGREDQDLRDWFAALGRLRQDHSALRRGGLEWVWTRGGLLAFARETAEERLLIAVNAGDVPLSLPLGQPAEEAAFLLGTGPLQLLSQPPALSLPPRSGGVLSLRGPFPPGK